VTVERPAEVTTANPQPVVTVETPTAGIRTVTPTPVTPAEDPEPSVIAGVVADATAVSPPATVPDTAVPAAEITIPAADSATVQVAPVTSEPVAAPAVAEKPAFGDQGAEVRMVLNAVKDSWIQIREANGDLVNAQLLRPGERYNVPNREGLVLLTGNAGGLELLVDGKAVPSLGPQGAIRRNVPLDPARLMSGGGSAE